MKLLRVSDSRFNVVIENKVIAEIIYSDELTSMVLDMCEEEEGLNSFFDEIEAASEKHIYIANIEVSHESRGRGYLRDLTKLFVETMKSEGKSLFTLICEPILNQSYSDCGFEEVCWFEDEEMSLMKLVTGGI